MPITAITIANNSRIAMMNSNWLIWSSCSWRNSAFDWMLTCGKSSASVADRLVAERGVDAVGESSQGELRRSDGRTLTSSSSSSPTNQLSPSELSAKMKSTRRSRVSPLWNVTGTVSPNASPALSAASSCTASELTVRSEKSPSMLSKSTSFEAAAGFDRSEELRIAVQARPRSVAERGRTASISGSAASDSTTIGGKPPPRDRHHRRPQA